MHRQNSGRSDEGRTGTAVAPYILIIAGGRDYEFKQKDRDCLKQLVIKLGGRKKVKIRNGGARGADTDGYLWAMDNNVPREPPVLADWRNLMRDGANIKRAPTGHLYDADAGKVRNERMARGDEELAPANGVVLFPGGTGTAHMHSMAVRYGLEIFDWRKTRC